MRLDKYINPDFFQDIAESHTVRGAKSLLLAAEKKRDEVTKQAVNEPQHTGDKNDVLYKLGFAAGLSWVLNLPETAKTVLSKLPEDKEL